MHAHVVPAMQHATMQHATITTMQPLYPRRLGIVSDSCRAAPNAGRRNVCIVRPYRVSSVCMVLRSRKPEPSKSSAIITLRVHFMRHVVRCMRHVRLLLHAPRQDSWHRARLLSPIANSCRLTAQTECAPLQLRRRERKPAEALHRQEEKPGMDTGARGKSPVWTHRQEGEPAEVLTSRALTVRQSRTVWWRPGCRMQRWLCS